MDSDSDQLDLDVFALEDTPYVCPYAVAAEAAREADRVEMAAAKAAQVAAEANMRRTPWQGRACFPAVTKGGQTLVLGGVYGEPWLPHDGLISEVWSTADFGQTWERRPDAPWSPRSDHAAVVEGERILVLGGGCAKSCCSAEVWSSSDGGWTWEQLPDAPWSPRLGHAAVAQAGRVLVLGGGCDDGSCSSEVWATSDSGQT